MLPFKVPANGNKEYNSFLSTWIVSLKKKATDFLSVTYLSRVYLESAVCWALC